MNNINTKTPGTSKINNEDSITHKVGDAIEKVGDKLEHSGFKKVGDAIEKLGDKLEHSQDGERLKKGA